MANDFTFGDKLALDYVRDKGYASYSSMKNIRDCVVPEKADEIWFKFGRELHSRWLEGKKIETLSPDDEKLLTKMIGLLNAHAVAMHLKQGAKVEQEFNQLLWGVRVLGYLDILHSKHIADLKSTKLTTRKQFIESMDFLQAALYLAVTGLRDFYYIGISKLAPHDVWVFNVQDYPARLHAAQLELRCLIKYIKIKL